MKSKFASKTADTLSFYLDEGGRYDIRKSEDRKLALTHMHQQPAIFYHKYDLIRNREIHEKNAITKLLNTIFGV